MPRHSRRDAYRHRFMPGWPVRLASGTPMQGLCGASSKRWSMCSTIGGVEGFGRSRAGLTTTIHAVVDELGRPLCFLPTLGQAADSRQTLALVEGLAFDRLIGDRGSNADELRAWLEEHGIEAVIPAKRNRKQPIPRDRRAYQGRHKVENLLCRIKDFGRNVLPSWCIREDSCDNGSPSREADHDDPGPRA